MTDRELMQQALHTLEGWANHGEWVWPESALEQAKRNTTESIAALRERLAQPETELETYKRLYELRGKALERPCINCGHQPAKIKTMAQPEQEPVAWLVQYPNKHEFVWGEKPQWIADAVGIEPLYTAPRQWKGLTDEEIKIIWRDIDGSEGMLMRFARAIEARLKEKNA